MAYAHFGDGRYAEAASWAEKAFRERPDQVSAVRILAASSAMAGRQDQAWKAVERLREFDPTVRLSTLKQQLPIQRPDVLDRVVEGLRKAGLPD
jgi:tetratricopeptide (TPR) repeat protein